MPYKCASENGSRMRRVPGAALLAAMCLACTATTPPIAATSAPARPIPTFTSRGPWYGPPSPIRPIGDAGVFGEIALRPSERDDYVLQIYAWGGSGSGSTDLVGPDRFSWSVAAGRCVDWSAASRGTSPSPRPSAASREFFEPRLSRSTLRDSSLWLLWQGDRSVACADLPTTAAQAREPLAAASSRRTTLRTEPGRDLRGEVTLSATASGDWLLRVESRGLDVSGGRTTGPNLLWQLLASPCDARGQVLFRANFPMQAADRQDFTLVVGRDERPLARAIVAIVNGGGPLVACADLEVP